MAFKRIEGNGGYITYVDISEIVGLSYPVMPSYGGYSLRLAMSGGTHIEINYNEDEKEAMFKVVSEIMKEITKEEDNG